MARSIVGGISIDIDYVVYRMIWRRRSSGEYYHPLIERTIHALKDLIMSSVLGGRLCISVALTHLDV